jgi:hypothetical protein
LEEGAAAIMPIGEEDMFFAGNEGIEMEMDGRKRM